jgi:uncharacterized protein YfaS (alpha-2-macroglobulin family)
MKYASFLILLFCLFYLSCGSESQTEYEEFIDTTANNFSEAQQIELKESLDFSESSINYFDIDKIEHGEFRMAEDDKPLTVVDFGPVGVLPVEMRQPTIYVVFSHPMVPLSRLGEPLKESPYMKISPQIPGIFRWYGSKCLSFEPEESFFAGVQRKYKVTILAQVKSLSKKILGKAHTFEFFNEYLNIASFHPGTPENQYTINYDDVPMDLAQKMTVRFTYPVDLALIKRYLRIQCNEKGYDFSLERPKKENDSIPENLINRSVIITLLQKLPENSKVIFTLTKGARSTEDCEGRPDDVQMSYNTLRPFVFKGSSSYNYSYPRSSKGDTNPVYLEFSHPPAKENIENYFSTSFNIKNLKEHIDIWYNTVKISNLPVEYDSSYVISISKNLKDIYGRTLGVDRQEKIQVGKATSYAYFPNTGSKMLEAAFPPRIIFEYQNVYVGKWKIGPINDPYPYQGISFSGSELQAYDFSTLKPNSKHYQVLDLSPYLNKSGKGFVGVAWHFQPTDQNGRLSKGYQENLNLQVTDMGVTTRYAYNKIIVWVASLSTGKPAAGATVTLLNTRSARGTSKTDGQGMAVFTLAPGEYRNKFMDYNNIDNLRIRVEKGDDKVEFRPNYSHNMYHFGIYSSESPIHIESERMETFLFTDRGLYKPGETVTFRGIDRTWSAGQYSIYQGPYTIEVRSEEWDSKPFYRTSGNTSATGGFYGSFEIPETTEPGYFYIEYLRGDKRENRYSLSFQVAHFRRLSFQVNLNKPDREYFLGDNIAFNAQATYLAGGNVAGGSYNYYWYKEPAYYKPPGQKWKSYVFCPSNWGSRTTLGSDKGSLSMLGTVSITQETTSDGIEGKPYRYSAEIVISDISRQELSATQSVIVHPASFYIGAKLPDTKEGWWSHFVESGKALEAEMVLVKADGETYLKDTTVSVELVKQTWKIAQQQGVYGHINTRYEMVEETVKTEKTLIRKASGKVRIIPTEAGSYILRFKAVDERNNKVVTDIYFYATGASWVRWGSRNPQDIDLEADKDIYAVGDKARILIKSPLPQGDYLLTVEREGIFQEKIIHIQGSAQLMEVPITEQYVPIIYIALSSYSKREATPSSYFEPDLGKPKGYFGILPVHVNTESKTCSVEIIPGKDIYRPGENAEVTVVVKKNGKPLADAEVTFLAADRGVLDLIGYHVPDPVAFFYDSYKFPLGVMGADSRSLLIDPVTYEIKDLQGGGGDDGKLQRRKDFVPLAVFKPYLVTDSQGKVVVRFKFPDTLTTYRSTALVVKENIFGIKEQEIMVQNPINVRTALPRLLRVRDTAIAGVIITNLAKETQKVTVSVKTDILDIFGNAEKVVQVEGGKSKEVAFNIQALKQGQATLVFTIRSSILSEELEHKLVVEKPLITEAFTVMGKTEQKDPKTAKSSEDLYAEEGFVIPKSIAPGYGDLVIHLDSTRITALGEAVEYLLSYPHGCVEQRLSAILPYILFGEKLEQFGSKYASYYTPRLVESLFELLAKYQHSDGGFCFWLEREDRSDPFVSAKVAHYIYLAQQQGYKIDSQLNINKLHSFLSSFYYNKYICDYLKIYALYILALGGNNVKPQLESFYRKGDSIGLSGYALIGLSYYALGDNNGARTILGQLRKFIKVGTRSIDLVETYEASYYFDSMVQKFALLLMLYHKLEPTSDMLQRITTTLLQRQKKGYWNNTWDTSWALISYNQLLKEESGSSTNFQADVFINSQPYITREFKGISKGTYIKEYALFEQPLKDLKRNVLFPIRLNKQGKGMLYYNMTIRYALPTEIAPARDEGFSVFSQIYDLDGNKIEGRELKLGQTYRMNTVISTSKRRTLVALRVPVPSGAEIIDASFVTSAHYYNKGGVNSREWVRETIYGDRFTFVGEGSLYMTPGGLFFDFYGPEQKIMDNEVIYYFDDLYRGKQEVTFLFRTTTPGIYPTPPAYAQCMYEEEVFGRSPGRLLVIK